MRLTQQHSHGDLSLVAACGVDPHPVRPTRSRTLPHSSRARFSQALGAGIVFGSLSWRSGTGIASTGSFPGARNRRTSTSAISRPSSVSEWKKKMPAFAGAKSCSIRLAMEFTSAPHERWLAGISARTSATSGQSFAAKASARRSAAGTRAVQWFCGCPACRDPQQALPQPGEVGVEQAGADLPPAGVSH